MMFDCKADAVLVRMDVSAGTLTGWNHAHMHVTYAVTCTIRRFQCINTQADSSAVAS